MKNKGLLLWVLLLLLFNVTYPQSNTDANIFGHVVHNGEHIPFANILIKGTSIGTATDETGHFLLVNLPVGEHIVQAQALGYKTKEIAIEISAGQTIELDFELETDYFGLDEVVVTGDRNIRNRRASTIVVNTLTPRVFEQSASFTVSEGLNFSSGLRMENNCQNCGFNQLRMNGLEGPYTQILINSRPIFSGLMGVYGLELIPTNMIDRIEIIRGGGSALYGSNAIGGTVNMILKDPIRNTFEFGVNSGVIGGDFSDLSSVALDNTINLNASVVTRDSRSGLSVYGFSRSREHFDATGDGLSELTQIENTTIGGRMFHRPDNLSKITLDFFNINEDRRGGGDFDLPYHQTEITEAVEHNIMSGALSYDRYIRETDQLSVFTSIQSVNRDSYYGESMSLSDYGRTNDFTYNIGAHYTYNGENQNLIIGVENTANFLKDQKLAYPDFDNAEVDSEGNIIVENIPNTTVADQSLSIIGTFAQYERTINKMKINVGARFDNYNIVNQVEGSDDNTGNVIVPRANVLYDFSDNLQTRIGYSMGYRAPQIFDEDLHEEASTSRRVIHRNDPNLRQEDSHSFTASADYNSRIGNTYFNIVAEGFYTILNNAFVNEFGDPDDDGLVVYTRTNAEEGAIVRGINIELNVVPNRHLTFSSGFTLQESFYEEVHEFGEKSFFRTPNDYGFFTIEWTQIKNLTLSSTGTYTGSMLVPYFGNTLENPENGELRKSEQFFDMGLRASYKMKLNGAGLEIFGGVRNIFNSYQSDFDLGPDRDPSYVYGPAQPRTIYLGLKFGNSIF